MESTHYPHRAKRKRRVLRFFGQTFLVLLSLSLLLCAGVILWISSLEIPDFGNFENRNVANSTKIYDRTGKHILYDVFQNVKRTEVSINDINPYVKQATISIEDADFYQHHGVRFSSLARAALANLTTGGYSQGGSTITQQVIKNALLTREKSLSRKVKEIILALKLDKQIPKDKILEIYLNESPYGGTLYGVEEASQTYFGKSAKDVNLVEASYLAALPQSPTRYSPYGQNRDALEARKNLVLRRMHELGYITEAEMTTAQNTFVTFQKPQGTDGVGLHFVFYVRDYLEKKYGDDAVQNGGLRIVTTLDYDLQKKLENIVKTETFDKLVPNKSTNSAAVVLDPKTGQILAMVGSRDFFDKDIDGQYNIAVANRQPGSSFKPIVYAEAFLKGYTPETVLFDVKTEFNSSCDTDGKPLPEAPNAKCYSPQNYDGTFHGPVSLRSALARSLNIPAVKVLYLVGVDTAVSLAQKMGLSTISSTRDYGLSLVLGGGEVTLLDLANAYGVFANDGVYSKPASILSITDLDGKIYESYTPDQRQVLPKEVTSLISSVLSDNDARAPTFGVNSALAFRDRQVAVKTGTTNDFRDLWVIGYTPSYVLGMWTGNNDNTPTGQKVSGQLLGPFWRTVMNTVLDGKPVEYFPEPTPNNSTKPILRGDYCDPTGVKSILAYVNKNDPRGAAPLDPTSDPQYEHWQVPISDYVFAKNICGFSSSTTVGMASGTTVQ